ncbi:MAG: hypothetical protein AAFP15_12225 [Bacteroidota bacterium]
MANELRAHLSSTYVGSSTIAFQICTLGGAQVGADIPGTESGDFPALFRADVPGATAAGEYDVRAIDTNTGLLTSVGRLFWDGSAEVSETMFRAGLTAVRAARLDNLDATITSRQSETDAATRAATNTGQHNTTILAIAGLPDAAEVNAQVDQAIVDAGLATSAQVSGISGGAEDDGIIRLYVEHFLQPDALTGAAAGDTGVGVFISRNGGSQNIIPTNVGQFDVYDSPSSTVPVFTLSNADFAPHADASLSGFVAQSIVPAATFTPVLDSDSAFYYVDISLTDAAGTVSGRSRFILQSQTANNGLTINARVQSEA